MTTRKKRPGDFAQRAKMIVDIATGEIEDEKPPPNLKNPAAVTLGTLGGKKGGPARAKSLTPERRSDIAKRAAKARWASRGKKAHSSD
jgi:hypothetical protein